MSSENQQVLRLQLAYLMHRFLLIALGMGFLLPTAANAETWYLLVKHGEQSKGISYSWTVPTASEAECDIEKKRVVRREAWHAWKNSEWQTISAICIKGK